MRIRPSCLPPRLLVQGRVELGLGQEALAHQQRAERRSVGQDSLLRSTSRIGVKSRRLYPVGEYWPSGREPSAGSPAPASSPSGPRTAGAAPPVGNGLLEIGGGPSLSAALTCDPEVSDRDTGVGTASSGCAAKTSGVDSPRAGHPADDPRGDRVGVGRSRRGLGRDKVVGVSGIGLGGRRA